MAAAVQVDSLVEGRCAVERCPVGDTGGIDILHHLEILDCFAFKHAGVVHIVQMASVRDQIGIILRSDAARKILQGQFHAREGVHLSALDDLFAGNGKDGRVYLVVRGGDIDRNLGAVGQLDIVPG